MSRPSFSLLLLGGDEGEPFRGHASIGEDLSAIANGDLPAAAVLQCVAAFLKSFCHELGKEFRHRRVALSGNLVHGHAQQFSTFVAEQAASFRRDLHQISPAVGKDQVSRGQAVTIVMHRRLLPRTRDVHRLGTGGPGFAVADGAGSPGFAVTAELFCNEGAPLFAELLLRRKGWDE